MRASTLVFPLAAAVTLLGCGSDTSPLAPVGELPADLSLNRTRIEAAVGDTVRLRLVGVDARAAQTVRWQAIDPGVALVEDGLVIPVGEGQTQVVAFVGSTRVSAYVQASAMGVSASTLVLPDTPVRMTPGDSTQINAELGYTNGVEVKLRSSVKWSSLDPTVATVSGGMVAAKKTGATKVVAQFSGMRDTMDVVVATMDEPVAPKPEPPPAPAPAPEPAPTDHVVPELPRVYLETSMPPVTGRSIRVAAGGNLQSAIDSAEPGDEIVLEAGATYTGTFRLRRKAGSGPGRWITIRTSGSLPPEGTRVTPAHASQMPRLVASVATEPVIRTEAGASHYRLVGLEVTADDDATRAYSLVNLGENSRDQNAAELQPSHLVLDRMYIHGTPRLDFQRCISLHSASTAIIDSWISECHGKGYDSQAIFGTNGTGPYKIVNNHLAGAGENIMFGGSDPKIPGALPEDIEIRGNHFYKPPEWQGRWTIKNLFELKLGRRILVEGNVFENNWSDAQVGTAIVLKSTNQSGSAPWSETRDLTFRYNLVRNVGHGVGMAGAPESKPAVPASRMLFEHNVFERVGTGDYKGGRMFSLSNVAHVTLRHNTALSSHSAIYLSGSNKGLTVERNIFGKTQYGVKADAGGDGTSALNQRAPGWTFTGNVVAGAKASKYPDDNTYPSTLHHVSGLDHLYGAARTPVRVEGATTTAPAYSRAAGPDLSGLARRIAGVVVAAGS